MQNANRAFSEESHGCKETAITVRRLFTLPFVMILVVLCHCTLGNPYKHQDSAGDAVLLAPLQAAAYRTRLAAFESQTVPNRLSITYPYDGAVFPPEIAAPMFRWTDDNGVSRQWLVVIQFHNDQAPFFVLAARRRWTPEKAIWEAVKSNSSDKSATVSVYGMNLSRDLTSMGRIRIKTSPDRVDAAILYRQVPLPFKSDKASLKRIKWRLGDIAAYGPPPVIMQKQQRCASCHTVSDDGRRISMEMNFRGDGGAQFIAPVSQTLELTEKHFMTWSDYPKPDILPPTRGTFAKLSPTGDYMVGTVNEISFFALTNDPAFCQLFFPTYGILAWYDVSKKQFHCLPGADDIDFVQTDPNWRHDGKQLVFARTQKRNEYHEDITNIRTHTEDAGIEALNQKYPIQFDLYLIDFNAGQGGVPKPLQGAAQNGMSNYFGRYSPDGRWIVYTRSMSGIMLQPDSELFMIPSRGGQPRRMICNRKRFNSWHSFSPNGRWLLFSSKANSDYTEIFLTHIDENGMDSPPVCLSRFSEDRLAANVPEFVNLTADAIRKIRLTEK